MTWFLYLISGISLVNKVVQFLCFFSGDLVLFKMVNYRNA
jgi:hypothetical protein